jgi:hypothetical protein
MCSFSNIHHLAQEVEKARAEEEGCSRAKQEIEKALHARELEYSMGGDDMLKPLSSSCNVAGPESPSRVV